MGMSARPQYGVPFSVLMFLPTGAPGSNIGATCRAWGSLLLEAKYWRDNFIVLGLSEYKERKCKEPKKAKEQSGGLYDLFHIGGASKGPKCLDKKEGAAHSGFCSEEKIEAKDLKTFTYVGYFTSKDLISSII